MIVAGGLQAEVAGAGLGSGLQERPQINEWMDFAKINQLLFLHGSMPPS